MKTPEEIAREAVTLKLIDGGEGPVWHVYVYDYWDYSTDDETHAREEASSLRAAVARAIREHAAQPPVPCDMTAQRLVAIRRWAEEAREACRRTGNMQNLTDAMCDDCLRLCDHIDFLHKIMNGPEAEACREAYERGRRDERRALAEQAEDLGGRRPRRSSSAPSRPARRCTAA